MKRAYNQVRKFHHKFGVPLNEKPTLPEGQFVTPTFVYLEEVEKPKTERQLRINLLVEEVEELFAAEQKNDIVEIADALADIIYIAIGTALAYGIPLHAVFEEVHSSNMTKSGRPESPTVNKITKGETYLPPNVAKAVFNPDDFPCCDYEQEAAELRDEVERLIAEVDDLVFERDELAASIFEHEKGRLSDLIERCSTCASERAMLGPSWVCTECLQIKKMLES